MNAYETKRAERIERMRDRADKLAAEGTGRVETARKRAEVIPLGQPILIGHHSERRDRNYRDKIHNGFKKGFELLDESRELARRADAAEESTAVSSDDPEAVTKLREKLVEAEKWHALGLAGNKAIRASKGDDEAAALALLALGLSTEAAGRALTHFFGDKPYGFNTTNSGADVRRIKERIAALETKASAPVPEPVVAGDVRIEESENRVRIFFPCKPDEAKRSQLKSHGFRWSPTAGAWQRQATPDAWYWARKIVGA